jgi:hypothetical protein
MEKGEVHQPVGPPLESGVDRIETVRGSAGAADDFAAGSD